MRSFTIRPAALLFTFGIAVWIDRRMKSPEGSRAIQMWLSAGKDIAAHPLEFLRVLWVTISST